MTKRPFNILGVQQIAIGGLEKSALETLWIQLLGFQVHSEFRSERENVDEKTVFCAAKNEHENELGHSASVEIDLMTPIDPEARPRVHEPALNHIGLWVDDLRGAVDWLGQQGVRFTPGGIRKGAAGHEVCFIHPKGNAETPVGGGGVLIELVQAPKSQD